MVEGSARRSWRERINFFNIASSSLSEVTYGLHAALRLGYLTAETHDRLDEMARMVAGPLHGLIRYERGQLARNTHGEK